jgi:hypothetical protein
MVFIDCTLVNYLTYDGIYGTYPIIIKKFDLVPVCKFVKDVIFDEVNEEEDKFWEFVEI